VENSINFLDDQTHPYSGTNIPTSAPAANYGNDNSGVGGASSSDSSTCCVRK
jgi:hypothetical protein